MTATSFGAVIVNYNCAPLALDAALSFVGAGGARAVIVDNASTDGSADYFSAALSGSKRHEFTPPPDQFPSGTVVPAVLDDRISILNSPKNGGFSYGCNQGLGLLFEDTSLTHFLLLNPDALLASVALRAFSERLEEKQIGLCGATIVDFEAPHCIQAFGGAALDPFWLVGRNLGEGAALEDASRQGAVESVLTYPLGAAMAFRRDYLRSIGPLDERYFLYYEEADWAFAAAPDFKVGWAREAIVYHRYGGSSKSRRNHTGGQVERSPVSDFHMTRSRILFAAKWRPHLAMLAAAAGGAQAATRIFRGKGENARAVLRASLTTPLLARSA